MTVQSETTSLKRSNTYLQARSYLMVLAALVLCFVVAYSLNVFAPTARPETLTPEASADIPATRVGNWQDEDTRAAQIAWKYF
jgi:hypothetical protein